MRTEPKSSSRQAGGDSGVLFSPVTVTSRATIREFTWGWAPQRPSIQPAFCGRMARKKFFQVGQPIVNLYCEKGRGGRHESKGSAADSAERRPYRLDNRAVGLGRDRRNCHLGLARFCDAEIAADRHEQARTSRAADDSRACA